MKTIEEMSDEEKAAIFIKRYWGTYTEAFRNETIPRLVKLIRDEREACAKIAREVREDRKALNQPDGELAAMLIEENIHARSL